MRRIAVLALTLALPVALAPVASAATEVATFEFSSEPGSFPVDGRSGSWALPDQEVMISENSSNWLRVQGDTNGRDFIGIELSAPGGAPVEVGAYTDVALWPGPDRAMLRVISGGLACAPVHGWFRVDRVERTDGRLTGLDVEVEQRCGDPAAPAFRAKVHLER